MRASARRSEPLHIECPFPTEAQSGVRPDLRPALELHIECPYPRRRSPVRLTEVKRTEPRHTGPPLRITDFAIFRNFVSEFR